MTAESGLAQARDRNSPTRRTRTRHAVRALVAVTIAMLASAAQTNAQPIPIDPLPFPTPIASPEASPHGGDPLAETPFRGERLSKLVLDTPGIARDDSRPNDGKLYVTLNGGAKNGRSDQATPERYVAFDAVAAGKTTDGDWLLVVPIRGTVGGAYAALVYRSVAGTATYVSRIDSRNGQLELAFRNGFLIVTAPDYAKNDDPCCPSRKTIAQLTFSAERGGLISAKSETIDVPRAASSPATR